MDIQLKIDDKLILDDSLHSSPFFPIILDEKLRYGVHKISVSSKKAGVNQESKVFLFLNQYIYVGFLGADTLYLEKKALVNRHDSVAVFQSLFIEKTSGRHQSEFVDLIRFIQSNLNLYEKAKENIFDYFFSITCVWHFTAIVL